MIENFTIKNVATYNNNGVTLNNLKSTNFIYGANGTGKTTITKLLHNPNNSSFMDCSIAWKNGASIQTLVYNKDFKERNFNKGSLDGVFTLGQATKEQIEQIEKKREALHQLKASLQIKIDSRHSRSKSIEVEQENFKERIWEDIFKEYESVFKPAFVGFMKKETFRGRLLREHQFNDSPVYLYEQLLKRSEAIFGNKSNYIGFVTNI